MSIICISRGSYGYSKNLARALSRKLGSTLISREMITDEAADFGIPVGKAEVAVLKKRPLSESLAVEIDLFKAFVTHTLCRHALEEDIVYHGRTGHLVLPGLSSVLRVRVIAPLDQRIELVMQRMNLSWEKARDYIEKVDEDILRWVRKLYNVDWNDPSLYDLTLSAAQLSVENAASALVHMAELPEVQETPASRLFLQDLWLASTCRLELAKDERLRPIKVSVQAHRGEVSVTYPPQQAAAAQRIPELLEKVEGVQSLICTVASTNILCVGQSFDPQAEEFESLIAVAEKWNAAIELVQLSSEEETEAEKAEGEEPAGEEAESEEEEREGEEGEEAQVEGEEEGEGVVEGKEEYNGGVLDDTSEREVQKGEGAAETMDRLIQVGRAGRYSKISGGSAGLLRGLSRDEDYSLIVVGDVFAEKKMAQKHLKRDLMGLLADKFRVPVLGMEELKSRYLFGPRQFLGLLFFAALAVLLYFAVFSYQLPILKFVSKGWFSKATTDRILEAVAVVLFVPLVASTVGGFYRNFLKLLKLE